MDRFGDRDTLWLFGYGSLIWKADFAWIKRRSAHIHGWSRRFWQGSHDHRGTADAPGRVVTLIRAANAVCAGTAYLITPEVFDHLDHREKNGYLRHATEILFDDDTSVEGLVYIATDANSAFLGPAPSIEIARHIAQASGPSGSNRDYLLHLAAALRDMNADDPHVFAIERQLLGLSDDAAAD
ncbi:MAG: gamma-glutamylcyclotransferase [Rhodanobacteraceae bacterium]